MAQRQRANDRRIALAARVAAVPNEQRHCGSSGVMGRQ